MGYDYLSISLNFISGLARRYVYRWIIISCIVILLFQPSRMSWYNNDLRNFICGEARTIIVHKRLNCTSTIPFRSNNFGINCDDSHCVTAHTHLWHFVVTTFENIMVHFVILRYSCSSSGSVPTEWGTICGGVLLGRHQSFLMAVQ